MKESLTEFDWSIFQGDLKDYVFGKVKDRALAEDIVHDVFLKARNKSYQLRERENFSGWLHRIAKNMIIDHFRRQSRPIETPVVISKEEIENYNECVENCLNKLLPTLPEKYRVALQLAELENISQVELARHFGISYSGLKSRVQRARQMLKSKIDQILIVKTDAYGNVIVCKNRCTDCKNT